jgi:membrane-bound lytic murein transglycosylase B
MIHNSIIDSSTVDGREAIAELLRSNGWRLHKKIIPQMRYNERTQLAQPNCKTVTSTKDNRRASETDTKESTPVHKTRSNS